MFPTQKILTTSDELFAKKGFENVSMQDISKASKISIGSIYHAFKNGKEEIAITLLKNYALDLQTRFGELLNQSILDEDLEKIFISIITILLELGQKYPSSFQLSSFIQTKELQELNQKIEMEICSKITFLLRLKIPEMNTQQAELETPISKLNNLLKN